MSNRTLDFVPNRSRGWGMGLNTMMSKEMKLWLKTHRWWSQTLIVVLLINGTMYLNLRDGMSADGAGLGLLMMMGLVLPVLAIVLASDSILGEKHSGTAAWVLSKPLQRPAFIVAKLISFGLGLFVVGVAIPGVLAYFQINSSDTLKFSALGFAGAMSLVFLNLCFFLTLSLMLSTIFDSRGPVLGIGLGLALGPMILLTVVPMNLPVWFLRILPWYLLAPIKDSPYAGYLAMDQSLPSLVPIFATIIWCTLFIAISIWRFKREEF